MKTISRNYLGIAFLLFGGTMLLFYTRSGRFDLVYGLVCLVLLPVLVVGSIHLISRIFVEPFSALRIRTIGAVAGLGFVLIVSFCGSTLLDYQFNSRRAAMEHFLSTVPVTNGWLSSVRGDVKVPDGLADYIEFVDVSRTPSNHVQANFELYGNSAMHHVFWYYNSQGDPPDARGYKRLATCWYIASG